MCRGKLRGILAPSGNDHESQRLPLLPPLPGALFGNRRSGVVYKAHYLTFFDVSIHEYFRALNHERYSDAKRTGCDFHVVKASVAFRGSLLFDDPFVVGVKVERIGRSSVTFVLGVFRGEEQEALRPAR